MHQNWGSIFHKKVHRTSRHDTDMIEPRGGRWRARSGYRCKRQQHYTRSMVGRCVRFIPWGCGNNAWSDRSPCAGRRGRASPRWAAARPPRRGRTSGCPLSWRASPPASYSLHNTSCVIYIYIITCHYVYYRWGSNQVAFNWRGLRPVVECDGKL